MLMRRISLAILALALVVLPLAIAGNVEQAARHYQVVVEGMT